jgi:exodeoxyribonuclease VII large subunit
MSEDRQYFSLQQVVQSIRKTIDERYQRTYWVKAEMHKLNLYPSGHAFPELVEKVDSKIVAQVNGTIWKHNLERINQQFVSVVKEPLKEGTLLLLHVKIVFSELYGLSLQILDIDPQFSLGALQRERDETLKRLHQENTLNRNQQLAFPFLPKRIAVISAESSKGLSDFMQVLRENSWGYQFFTFLFPAYLQGDPAVPSILAQLTKIEHVKHHFDAVVIVRGGGGEVGLSCYNNYDLCMRLATFPLPVLTGIGHSTNMTVAEMVAFRNAITPTELADFFIQCFHEAATPVLEAEKRLAGYTKQLLERSTLSLLAEVKQFNSTARLFLERQQHQLNSVQKQAQHSAKGIIASKRQLIHYQSTFLHHHSKQLIREFRERLKQKNEELILNKKQLFDFHQQQLEQKSSLIRLLDPRNVLKRGYSITTFNGKTVNDANLPQPGEKVTIETYDTTIESTVNQVTSHEKN